MKIKIIIFIAAGVLLITLGFMFWRQTCVRRPKYIIVKKRAAAPTIALGKIAIVVDDFGYNINNVDEFLNIGEPITLSILPNLPYSGEIAAAARRRGYEVILHLPLESHRKDVREEEGTINSKMTGQEVLNKLKSAMESVRDLSGVSNHMGSKATEDKQLMEIIFSALKKEKLYFFDSLTSRKSVCQEAAKKVGIRFAKRDVFLDLGKANDADYIRKQVLELKKRAFKKGYAIGICHDRKNTVKVLAEMMPDLKADGVRFVYLSELVN